MRRAVALISGGKDSIYSLHLALWQGFDVSAVGIAVPPPDSMVVQHENVRFAEVHARALGLPTIFYEAGAGEDSEITAIHNILHTARSKYCADWAVVGALSSDYQRVRFNYPAKDLGLKVHTPLWHVNPHNYLKNLIRDGFEFIITRVAAEGLDRSWLGRRITKETLDDLFSLADRHSFNPVGEGGEYESFVVKTPLYGVDVRGAVKGNSFIINEVELHDTC